MNTLKISFLMSLLFFISMNARAEILDVARDANGKIKLMDHSEALKYCSSQGAHLPTAREYAQLAMTYGAKGIVDKCDSIPRCYLYDGLGNPDGSKDEFLFSYYGYFPPEGDHGKYWYWSSSVLSQFPYYAYAFVGTHGDLITEKLYKKLAVRCASGM